MRSIPKPKLDILATYNLCLSGSSDDSLKNRLDAICNDILIEGLQYDQYAQLNQLHLMHICSKKNHEVIVGLVKKIELKEVYTSLMVGAGKSARKIYDLLRESAPSGICPYCGFTPVGTLDHYLPKAKYPKLSVLPYNLVPACGDCNKGKLAQTANSPDQQTIHPYYDDARFINEQWLFAEVIKTSPPSIRFFVNAPATWSIIDQERVSSHFRCYKLAKRFSVVSSTSLSAISGLLSDYFQDKFARKKHLQSNASSYSKVHINSWEAAMFQALADSEWYCDIGYK